MNPPIEVLLLPAAAAAELEAGARLGYPREACGFLIGISEENRSTVTRVEAAVNRAETDDRYTIDAEDVFEARRCAGLQGEDIVGVFHSHPDADPRPSDTDIEDAWGGWVHLIVGCDGGEVTSLGCWWWNGSEFVPVTIEGRDS